MAWFSSILKKNRERATNDKPVSVAIPTDLGEFKIYVWSGPVGQEVVALTTPNIDNTVPVLVRIHSECLTGDALHSLRCDCGPQKDEALRLIADSGNGIFIYLRQEGRGIGLYEKIKAYQLQEKGYDTFEANVLLGHKPDEREYSWAGDVLRFFKVNHIRLLTNNPSKVSSVAALGFSVTERVPLVIQPQAYDRAYIDTKHKKFKHFFGEGEGLYFFQFSYVTSPDHVQEMGEWLKGKLNDPYLRICTGIYADSEVISNSAMQEKISELFSVTKMYSHFVPILHFSFKHSEDPVGDVKKIRELLPFVEYIQLNDVACDDLIDVTREACRYFLVDIGLDSECFDILEKDDELVSLVKKYKAFVCLDNSKGTGKQESFDVLTNKIDACIKRGVTDIAVFGGFGPGGLDTYFRLRDHYAFNISIDAETHLKSEQKIDLSKIKRYLSELLDYSHNA